MATERPAAGRRGPARGRGRPPHPDILTPAEWRVLELVREGLSNPEIAGRLGLSRDTVKTHVRAILAKLGVASREEAAAWEPEAGRRPWWAAGLGWLRPVTVGKAALIGASVAVVAGLGVLAWGVLRESREEPVAVVAASPTATPDSNTSPTPVPTPTPFYLSEKTPVTTHQILSTDRDGTRARVLTRGFNIEWSPVANRIAYVGSSTGPGLGGVDWVHIMDLDSGESTEIGAYDWSDVGIQCAGFGPGSWSPDGTEFAIWRPAGEIKVEGGIVDLETGGRRDWSQCYSEWLPDNSLVYGGGCDGQSGGWCIHVWDGKTDTQLVSGERPAVSPDGTEVAYFRDRTLYVLTLSTRTERALASVEIQGPDQPDWSPDGSQIAFSGEDVVVANKATGQTRTIGRGMSPRWSPDGTRIAYSGSGEEPCGGMLHVVEANGARQIFAIPGAYYDFSWSPDGSQLAYSVPVNYDPGNCPIATPPVIPE